MVSSLSEGSGDRDLLAEGTSEVVLATGGDP
jgi:hypothetical protein